jgi:hypothetical protein
LHGLTFVVYTHDANLTFKIMAVRFNVSECKKGYGVYVASLSGNALKELSFKFYGMDLTGVEKLTVKSDRITRKPTLQAATKVKDQLNAIPEANQIDIIRRLFIKPCDKNYVAQTVQYFKISRIYDGQFIPLFSTPNKVHAESVATKYAGNNVPAKLTPTVKRTKFFNKEDLNAVKETMEVKAAVPKGITGICKPIAEQGNETLNRIGQRRKRTTSVNFWNKR